MNTVHRAPRALSIALLAAVVAACAGGTVSQGDFADGEGDKTSCAATVACGNQGAQLELCTTLDGSDQCTSASYKTPSGKAYPCAGCNNCVAAKASALKACGTGGALPPPAGSDASVDPPPALDGSTLPPPPATGDSGSPGADAACAQTTTGASCNDCCANNHAHGVQTGGNAFGSCACASPGVCATQCAQSYCVGQTPQQGDACDQCLGGAQQCDQAANQACQADPDCVAFLGCRQSSQCDSKP